MSKLILIYLLFIESNMHFIEFSQLKRKSSNLPIELDTIFLL